MSYIFIDSNIWLSLYSFTNDDLNQFKKLKGLICDEVRLIIPSQLCDEFYRNRENKIRESLKNFSMPKLQVPAFAKGYAEEYEKFGETFNQANDLFKKWNQQINDDIKTMSTPADIVIQDFFHNVDITYCDQQMVAAAYDRYNRGNPPGKDKKYGDAINWECLLRTVSNGEDLYLVSSDKDYRSEINRNDFNPFLAAEWQKRKKSQVFFYTSLVDFLKEKEIDLKDEQEKQDLIYSLLFSGNYATTHVIIEALSRFTSWTDKQKEDLCEAAVRNSQVGEIFEDIDVLQFYSDLLSGVDYEKLDDCFVKAVKDWLFAIEDYYQNEEIENKSEWYM